MAEGKNSVTKTGIFGGEEIGVIYRKARTQDDILNDTVSRFVYPPPAHRTVVDNGIIKELDVAVTLRDGTMIYCDIYRPEGVTQKIPAIVAWSPYGKFESYGERLQLPLGVPPNSISSMAKFESPDPGFWCHQGYALVNPDVRGAGNSQGEIRIFGTQDGKDGYDLVEWLAKQDWSNGKVGLTGVSWVAMVQWYIAAEQPPHLACIAPSGGTSDIYREFLCWGGIPEVGFNNMLVRWMRNTLHGRTTGPGLVEDHVEMIRKYPLMNGYWEDKIPKFENISIPVYASACWLHFHLRGTVEGWRRVSSPKKWLRFHRDSQWADFHHPIAIQERLRFFDRYLKEIYNGFEQTPRVQVDVMDATVIDHEFKRPERTFPLPQTQYTKLYLDAKDASLGDGTIQEEASVGYEAVDGLTTFEYTFKEDTELTGYLKLRLWVEAEDADDMDLFITVQKLDTEGEFIPLILMEEPHPGLPGKLRVSHRELDEEETTDFQPIHTHKTEQLLKPGEIVPVDIEIWPTSILWHCGEKLRLVISGHYIRQEGWTEPFIWELRNKGRHIIHTGGKHESYLQIPVIPLRYNYPTPNPFPIPKVPEEYKGFDGLAPWRALYWN